MTGMSFLGVFFREMKASAHTNMCVQMLIEALFLVLIEQTGDNPNVHQLANRETVLGIFIEFNPFHQQKGTNS